MEQKLLVGIKRIATYFNLSLPDTLTLLQSGGIPGARKEERERGGRGVWLLNEQLADHYRYTRRKTPQYDPARATQYLLEKFKETGCKDIPALVDSGYIDDIDWCNELDRQRSISQLHVPILMHPADLTEWLGYQYREEVTMNDLFPETTEIFKKARRVRMQKGE